MTAPLRGDRDGELVVTLETPPPEPPSGGARTAVFCSGFSFHSSERIADLTIRIDGGTAARPMVWGAPRADLRESLGGHAYRSGFWAVVPLLADPGRDELVAELVAELDDGRCEAAELFRFEVADSPSVGPVSASSAVAEDLVAICMATYEPDLELLAAQIASLRAQRDENWVCVISDDHSSEDRFAGILELVRDDQRFTVSRGPRRLGFYRNFERALTLAPIEAQLLALCDQDDRWHADKLSVLREALEGEAILAYSDQRPVLRDGTVLRESLWEGRRSNHTNLASMAIANTIVGASMMFRRELLESALPFPEGPGWQFHDHWLALVALCSGMIKFVDRPLYDYVQHEGAIVGNVSVRKRKSKRGPTSMVRRLPWRSGLPTRWRAIYFRSYVQIALQAEVALLRCERRMTAHQRRSLRRIAQASRNPTAILWLMVRPVRELWGWNETLGSEWHLLKGLLWRYAVAALAPLLSGHRSFDSTIPPFDVETFGQARLERWLSGRGRRAGSRWVRPFSR